MIAKVLEFLRNNLNKAMSGDLSDEAVKDLLVYINTKKDDSVSFDSDAISISLIRIEEETSMRQGDPYIRKTAAGQHLKVAPEIRMNLWVLFVARFPNDYARALQHLSNVIGYFQSHRVFNRKNSPDLNAGVSKLILELVTPSFSEQNQIWGLLRSAYHPSVLYKVKMIVFQDEEGEAVPAVSDIERNVSQEEPSR